MTGNPACATAPLQFHLISMRYNTISCYDDSSVAPGGCHPGCIGALPGQLSSMQCPAHIPGWSSQPFLVQGYLSLSPGAKRCLQNLFRLLGCTTGIQGAS
jgi:hypothetical protein